MFNRCSILKQIDLSHFDTRKVTNMNAMFYRCYCLKKLSISDSNMKNFKLKYNFFFKAQEILLEEHSSEENGKEQHSSSEDSALSLKNSDK